MPKRPETTQEWLDRYEAKYNRAFENYQSGGDPKYDRQQDEYMTICDALRAKLERENERGYIDKGLLMFLALSFPAPEEAPDDWFHHGDENLDAWRAYIMKCKERGYYDIPMIDGQAYWQTEDGHDYKNGVYDGLQLALNDIIKMMEDDWFHHEEENDDK